MLSAAVSSESFWICWVYPPCEQSHHLHPGLSVLSESGRQGCGVVLLLIKSSIISSQCEFIWSDIAYCTSWLHSSPLTLLSIYTCYCSWWRWRFQILRDLKHWNIWLMIKDSFLLSVVMCEGRWCVESRAGQLQIQMTFIQSVSSVDNPRQGRAVFWPSSLLTLIMITESHSLVCRKIVGWN